MDEFKKVPGGNARFVDLVAKDTLKVFAENDPVGLHVPFPNDIVGGPADDAETLLALLQGGLGPFELGVFGGGGQGAAHRRHQAGWPLFQNVVGGSLLQAFDGDFLADRAGKENKGCFRLAVLGDAQGLMSVKRGQAIVGDNEIKPAFIQGAGKLEAVARDRKGAMETAFPQQFRHENVVHFVVFQVKDPQLSLEKLRAHG